ncbi:MAG TPA: bifunctional diaminohydroxyphosphoribosylaminopyrimidine deaminase/5-amino-6-(5-phosphoribosylamino)uracil reductase RibD, partial [Gammaproteobacteria bacterium]
MARAIELARNGLYTTDPNPRVGCVIVKAGVVLAEGWHERAGGPHAEAAALQRAGANAAGSTVYVTLEPCCHFGRTPPCADALIGAKVARVVVAGLDPNPLVSGKGLEKLRDAGIEVECNVLAAQAEALNPGFIKRMRAQLPFVRCKVAMSLDGRTAMASGESQWITGDEARQDVH